MSEREAAEPEPMSASMREYIDAFSAVELPATASAQATWSAIDDELKPDRRRVIWFGATAAMVAAAALVLMVGGLEGSVLDRALDDDPSVLAPHEGGRDATGGALSIKESPVKAERGGGVGRTDEAVAPLEAGPVANPVAETGVPGRPTPIPGFVPEADKPAPIKRTREPRKLVPEPDRSLSAELERFKAAKQALNGGEATRAIALLDAYTKDFRRGALRLEAQVLRAEALCAAGRSGNAEKLRDRFLEAHPGSPLASRMRDVCR